MVLHIVAPYEQEFPMTKNEWGYFDVTISYSENHLQYYFKPDSIKNFPDPGSHYQPEGVHGPSQIVNHSTFVWTDNNWKGISLHELVLYEVHVGTFTPERTFQAIIPRLNDLKNTGINALELMPVTAFPGERNWGYDSVYPYAVQHSYGGPEGLKKIS